MTRVLYMVMEHGEKDLSRMLKEVIAARISSNPDSYSGGGGVRTALTDAKVKFYWEEMLEAVQVISILSALLRSLSDRYSLLEKSDNFVV